MPLHIELDHHYLVKIDDKDGDLRFHVEYINDYTQLRVTYVNELRELSCRIIDHDGDYARVRTVTVNYTEEPQTAVAPNPKPPAFEEDYSKKGK